MAKEKTLQDGETIEYVTDVMSPASQAGKKGDIRIVGKEISKFAARYLRRGGRVKRVTNERSAVTNVGRTISEGNQKTASGQTNRTGQAGRAV